VRKKLKKKSFC